MDIYNHGAPDSFEICGVNLKKKKDIQRNFHWPF